MASWLDDNVGQFDLFTSMQSSIMRVAAPGLVVNIRRSYVVRPLGTLDPWGMSQKRLMKTTFWHVSGKRMMRGASAVITPPRLRKKGAEDLLSLNHGHVVPLGIDLKVASLP